MLQIVGTITTTTHVHQTDPNREGNLNRTLKTYLWDKDRQRHQVPFITANSIRGQLRRAAADLVLNAINEPVSRALFSVLTSGKASRKDIGLTPTTRALVEGSTHPFAGLFGGGGYMLPSRYTMAPLMPIVEWCHQLLHPSLRDRAIPVTSLSYAVSDGQRLDVPLVTPLILTSRDDVIAGKGQNHISNYQKSVDEWLKEVTSGRIAKAQDKATKDNARKKGEKVESGGKAISSDIAGFNLIEAILPGTPLQFWLRFKPIASEAQVGLMLMAVCDWANANVIGGASARGFGRFNATLAFYDNEHEITPSIFNINDQPMAYTLAESVTSWVEAAETALASMKAADLENAYATNVPGI